MFPDWCHQLWVTIKGQKITIKLYRLEHFNPVYNLLWWLNCYFWCLQVTVIYCAKPHRLPCNLKVSQFNHWGQANCAFILLNPNWLGQVTPGWEGRQIEIWCVLFFSSTLRNTPALCKYKSNSGGENFAPVLKVWERLEDYTVVLFALKEFISFFVACIWLWEDKQFVFELFIHKAGMKHSLITEMPDWKRAA